MVLVHNTNLLSSLVKGFVGMRTLYLLHDLRVHVGARDPGMVHVGPSELRQLYGDCSALGVNHLVVDTEAACALAGVCPNVSGGRPPWLGAAGCSARDVGAFYLTV